MEFTSAISQVCLGRKESVCSCIGEILTWCHRTDDNTESQQHPKITRLLTFGWYLHFTWCCATPDIRKPNLFYWKKVSFRVQGVGTHLDESYWRRVTSRGCFCSCECWHQHQYKRTRCWYQQQRPGELKWFCAGAGTDFNTNKDSLALTSAAGTQLP